MAQPTVIHATHWKAGSQWVRWVLEQAVPDRIVALKDDMTHVSEDPIVPGGVYTPVYLRRERIEAALEGGPDARVFAVIRDPRDVLVSWYFSLRYSHGENDWVAEFRRKLEPLDDEAGLLEVLHGPLWSIFKIQEGWLGAPDVPVIKYEELLADEQGAFEAIFRHCGLDVGDERRRDIVGRASFAAMSGRKRGQEDVKKHMRKAVAGDWRNHFTDRVREEFKGTFGDQLVRVGYESGLDW